MVKQSEKIKNPNKSNVLFGILSICLIVFIIAISLLIASFNKLMLEHDEKMTGELCTIMAEKINLAIESMNDTTEAVAIVLSAESFDTVEQAYDTLNFESFEYMNNDQFLSMGLLDANKKVYATEPEIREFEKWNLTEIVDMAEPVSMSVPYRSKLSGQPVITQFAKFYYGDNEQGWLYVTYKFNNLQKIANTQSVGNHIEVDLVDSKSFNVIICVSNDEKAVGSWSNAYLIKQNLDASMEENYNSWLKAMRNGVENISSAYTENGIRYIQYSTKIASMPGWYLEVRVSSEALSATLGDLRNLVINFIVVLLVVVLVLMFVMYKINKRENALLEEISENDSLTGLHNRRAFELYAKERIDKGKYFVLILLDIDHFKDVNDNLGHDMGDELLEKFSSIMSNTLGKDAILFRLGGDEFVALTELNIQEEIDEKLKQSLEEIHRIKLSTDAELKRTLSFSAGASRFPFDAAELDTLLKCADRALYHVKQNGRDGYYWYEDLENKNL